MNALSLKRHIAQHGEKEVWFTPPRADFSVPVVSCCTSLAMNYTDSREGLECYSPVLGCVAYPEQVQTSKGLQKVHGLTLKQFYQDSVDSRNHRMFVKCVDSAMRYSGSYEINRFKIHDEWIELMK